jgi:hypothetical protein
LIEVAKPPVDIPATPVLRSMACKLVSAMPTSAAAAAFRIVVTSLPAASKERLQVALRENAAAEQAAGGSSVAAGPPGAAQAAGAQQQVIHRCNTCFCSAWRMWCCGLSRVLARPHACHFVWLALGGPTAHSSACPSKH